MQEGRDDPDTDFRRNNPVREIPCEGVSPVSKMTTIRAMDEPGPGGANHDYLISAEREYGEEVVQCLIAFQKGGLAEGPLNGISDEALLTVLCDRLRSFQAGPFSCRENAVALTHLETAGLWLGKRTLDRERRGVEGKQEK